MADPALAALKLRLLRVWDAGVGAAAMPPPGGVAEIHTFVASRPRGGLAVGHVRLPDGRPRVELRVAARRGPLLAQAQAVARVAQADGFEAVLRAITRPVVGLFDPDAATVPKLAGRRVPLHPGAAVAHERALGAGTLGALVRLRDGAEGFLSCSHVLARPAKGRPESGDPIQQPGPPGILPPAHRVADLSDDFAPFSEGSVANLDAAVARLRYGVAHAGNVFPPLDCVPPAWHGRPLGPPIDADDLPLGTPVVKLGHRTGFTRATLTAVEVENVRMQVGRRERDRFTLAPMHEVSWTAADEVWSRPGDSGALVCTAAELRPIGLHACAVQTEDGFAGYIVPWQAIVDAFHISLL